LVFEPRIGLTDLRDHSGELENGNFYGIPDVHNVPCKAGTRDEADEAADQVCHVAETPGLLTIAEDREGVLFLACAMKRGITLP